MARTIIRVEIIIDWTRMPAVKPLDKKLQVNLKEKDPTSWTDLATFNTRSKISGQFGLRLGDFFFNFQSRIGQLRIFCFGHEHVQTTPVIYRPQSRSTNA